MLLAMQRYNIALLPVKTALQEALTRLSRQHFLEYQDSYILGPEGLAHVTLCQFHAPAANTAQDVFRSFQENVLSHPTPVTITDFRIRPGTLVNSGFFIAEYSVRKDEALTKIQQHCAALLEKAGLKPLTPVAAYAPHFTLARVHAITPTQPSLADLPDGVLFDMRPALGLSTESGVFVREL